MELTHENRVIGLSKVGVIVASKLVVSVDHVANSLHHPLNCVHGADAVGISVEHSDWGVGNVLDWDVGGDSVLLSLDV